MIVNRELAKSSGCANKDNWATPERIFDKLNNEFHFTLDPCANTDNAKCQLFFDEEKNGLLQSWFGHSVFVNPPYSRVNIDKWVKKCYEESKFGAKIVALLPVSTSSDWWHKWVIGKAELRFVNKRIRFVGAPHTAPFSSVIVIWGSLGIKTFNQQSL